MPRRLNHFVCLGLLVVTPIVTAQSLRNDNLATHLDQLHTCREGILDPQARSGDRLRWAVMLLSYDTPEAREMIIELLRWNRAPEVQRAISAVVADQARKNPDRLDDSLVIPLMELLDTGDATLRKLAAAALAEFPGSDVSGELSAVASYPDAPLQTRLAAIDALAPNTHRREVVGQLVDLFDAGVPEITERVIRALEPITNETLKPNPIEWRAWWHDKSRLSAEAWQAEQLRLFRDRSRQYRDELDSVHRESQRGAVALTERIGQFQRELFRTVSEEKRHEKLNEWLRNDSFPIVQQTALDIIKTRINDEGYKPEGTVLTSLLKLLREGTQSLRREALGIVQNLNDAVVLTSVLDMLEVEDIPATRHAIFKALGKLDCVEAIPAFIREINKSESSPECVREAANALGMVAGKSKDENVLSETVDALKRRYEQTTEGNAPMQSALLTAMAGVANPAFTPEFREAIDSDDPNVLRPAIRGMVAVKDPSRMRRLRTLMAHSDPLVRLVSIQAIGQMGRAEADLESLLTRMNPSIEPDDRVREAAYKGFSHLLSFRTSKERIDVVERLRDYPSLQVRYLESLADSLSSAKGDTTSYQSVLHRLVTIMDASGRYGESASYLRTLYELSTHGQQNQRFNMGLQLLTATLNSGTFTGIGALIRDLNEITSSRLDSKRITQTIQEFVARAGPSNHKDQFRRLLSELQSIPTGGFGNDWSEMIYQVASLAKDGNKSKPAP